MLGWRPPLVSDPPEVGQHNGEVLAGIGYDKAGVAALQAAGALGPKPGPK
jgi:crotonobetainyl-CoA:carnitine CoA-transferase CaiB-like acyl-CoA transferase